MKVLGIRASAQELRYAILDKNSDGDIIFVNKDSEHCLRYPATVQNIENKLYWVKQEFDRIFRQHSPINKIVIKMNEYAVTENAAKRETSYLDAIILLLAVERNIQVQRKLYSQIGTTSKKTKEDAESRVGITEKYWNTTMADAINCAFWEARRG